MAPKKGFGYVLCFCVSLFLVACAQDNDSWISTAFQNGANKNTDSFKVENAGGATGTQPWQNGASIPCNATPTNRGSCFYQER